MITIYNSNLDFDLGSSNSITLSSTSNMVFKTNGTDKMSIVNNGISVSGNVVVSGLITSTGAGFSGIGANLTNIPISAINELRLELNGGTTDLSVTRDTLNARIVSEIGFGSNYTNRINSELNTRVDNTSNYVLATSNILIGRIINTSNYIDSTSNFLSVRIDNTSNYALATSNILIGRIINTSNYVDSTSNFLSGRIDNTSNYALATSNILIGRIINTSNYVDSTSNFLSGRIDNTSNYVNSTSNILIGRLINTSNYVDSTSNTLIGRVINASNYAESTSNFLSGRIDNTSNYVLATSNILIGRLINTSNYVLATSNILVDYNNLINKPFQSNGVNIFNNSGNVGIGTNATPLSLMEIITANYTGALLTLDAGVINSTTQMPRSIGRPLLKLGKTSYSTSAGDYYGIGFGISPTLSDYNCAEIGTIITSTTGLETGDIIFSTRPGTNNVIATERMRITSTGNVGVGTTDTTTYKLNVGGTLNTSGLFVNGTALTTTIGLKQDVLTSANTIGVFNTTTDFVVNGAKIELTNNTCNYVTFTSNLLSKRIDSTSNYSDRVGVWGSNYSDKVGVWSSNYSDRVGVWSSNYAYDKVGVWSSNYSDRVGVWGSNYAYDKVGVWSSNYTDRVGVWGSNYAYDKVGVWSSNYTDRIGERSSNYVLATSNILIGRVINTSNYVSSYKPATAVKADTADKLTTSRKIANVPFDGSSNINISYNSLDNILNASTGISIDLSNNISATYASADLISIFNTTDFANVNSKIELTKNTSNYVLATSNILIGRIINTSNYVSTYKPAGAVLADTATAMAAGSVVPVANGGTGASTFTAGGLIAGNTTGALQQYAGLSYTSGTTTLNTPNLAISTNAIITGNVGIGTATIQSSYKLQVQGNNWVENQLVFNNSLRGSGADYACNKISLYNGGNTPTTSSQFGFGITSGFLEYFSSAGHLWYSGTTGGTSYGTERMRIASNGNVGIGTTDTATYKLNVGGDLNTTGLYVNGTQFTGSSQWTGTTNIYNTNTGNVGIGTSSPLNGLHIYSNNINKKASLAIQDFNAPTSDITINPSVSISSITGTDYKYIALPYSTDTTGARQTQYSISFPGNYTADILVIGGGGGGGRRHGAGGGAGTLLYHKNITLNGDYTIKVGAGGIGCAASQAFGAGIPGLDGANSQFIKNDGSQEYFAVGGGRGNTSGDYLANTNGGQGYLYDDNITLSSENKFNGVAVAVSNKQYVNTLTSPEGCRGNIGGTQITNFKGGGGGGAGSVGQNHDAETTINDGYGGLGLSIDITGTAVVYAGGGNGADFQGSIAQVFNPSYSTIESRGGGGYGSDTGLAQAGKDGTGGGGGGQGNDTANAGKGGDGIVIIRYIYVIGNPELQLIIGDGLSSGNNNYKIGNNNGIFQINSSKSSIDTNAITIIPSGNIGIGTTSAVEKLNVNGSISLGTYYSTPEARYVGYYNTTTGNDCLTGMEIENTTLNGNYSQKLHLRTHYFGYSAGRRLTIDEDGNVLIYKNLTLDGTWSNPSDIRIKKDIEDINDETALNKLLLIKPATYNYIDEQRNKGFGKVYGFIAQQIKEVIPEAVTIIEYVIPNIYKRCLVKNKREIYHNIPLDTRINIEVKINNTEYKIKEVYEDYFVIDKDIDANDAFVFGYSVNDFNTLSKDYIFTLNVCATQELHRIIKSQEDRIKELETKMSMILNNYNI